MGALSMAVPGGEPVRLLVQFPGNRTVAVSFDAAGRFLGAEEEAASVPGAERSAPGLDGRVALERIRARRVTPERMTGARARAAVQRRRIAADT